MENVIASSLIRVSISKLVHSPLNVRKKQGAGIAELAALIFSQGLIHNLVVVAEVVIEFLTFAHVDNPPLIRLPTI